MSVLQGLRRACQINPSGVATIDGGRRRTWIEFRDRVARFAGVLRAANVQQGDRVAILSLNGDAYLEYFYAAPCAHGRGAARRLDAHRRRRLHGRSAFVFVVDRIRT